MTATPTLEFSNDRHLSSKSDDKLNRVPFAERVAGVLRERPKGAGLVRRANDFWNVLVAWTRAITATPSCRCTKPGSNHRSCLGAARHRLHPCLFVRNPSALAEWECHKLELSSISLSEKSILQSLKFKPDSIKKGLTGLMAVQLTCNSFFALVMAT